MLDQNAFLETLHMVQEVAAASDRPMTREEALSYFKDMELSPEQQELVYRFLQQPGGKGDPVPSRPEADVPSKDSKDQCTVHFQMYMRQVKRIAKLEQDQERLLYQRLLSGDWAVIEEISHQWLQRIVTMAREYQKEGFYLDDLVQEGNMALLTELHKLVGQQGTEEPEKRLVEAVMDAMEQYMGLESGAQQQEETILAKVSLLHEAREFLRAQSGEEPSVTQLMDYTRLSRQEIEDIMDLMEKARKA